MEFDFGSLTGWNFFRIQKIFEKFKIFDETLKINYPSKMGRNKQHIFLELKAKPNQWFLPKKYQNLPQFLPFLQIFLP